MGSTTTDIVPVAGSALRSQGYTDAERLAAGAYVTREPGNPLAALQEAIEVAEQVKPLERRVFDARRAGEIKADDTPGQIDEAERLGLITAAEGAAIRAFDRKVLELTGVDDFDPRDLPRRPAGAT